MPNFDIITTVDTGRLEVLSYGSENIIKYGQLVSVLVRNKSCLGICITKNYSNKDLNSGGVVNPTPEQPKNFDIKPVESVLPIILPTQSLDLIFKTHAFSWNKISSIVSAVLQSFTYIQKQIPIITRNQPDQIIDMTDCNYINETNHLKSKPKSKFSIYNESNISLRITYLIRNRLSKSIDHTIDNNGSILILFPDTATLKFLEYNISDQLQTLSKEFNFEIIVDKYSSDSSILTNRKTITHIIETGSTENKLQIVLSTRSGIFLPFKRLLETFLIEESSNNYIQEQNSLYFDCRDISYILGQIWGCDVSWISHLPSSRSLAFDSGQKDEVDLQTHDFYNIQIHEKNSLVDDNHIFSSATENIIKQDTSPVLFIHPRRGNFRVTQCQQCRHIWQCPDCSASLITYKNNYKRLDLICHHCQSKFDYPLACPQCKGTEVASYSSGIDDLLENLTLTYPDKTISKIETATQKAFNKFLTELELQLELDKSPIFLTSKVFDPRIPYSSFKSIVIIQAQNLAVGCDYLTTEEIYISIFSLYLKLKQANHANTKLIFDTTNPELELLQKFLKLNLISLDSSHAFEQVLSLYRSYIKQELTTRQKFHLPPYRNLLLLSINGKNHEKTKENIFTLYKWLKNSTAGLQPELELTSPYPARLLKRKGYFTYHLLLKYPKNFKKIKELDQILKPIIADMHLQARLNPRHVF